MATSYATQTFSGTAAATASNVLFNSTAASGGIPIRYGYVVVSNTGATNPMYVRTDGTAAVSGADFNYVIEPLTSMVISNGLRLWTQAAGVIQAGLNVSSPLAAGSPGWPGTPATEQPLGTSAYGQTASPGTNVSFISAAGTTFTVTGTG